MTHPTCVLSSAGSSHPFPISTMLCPDTEHSLIWNCCVGLDICPVGTPKTVFSSHSVYYWKKRKQISLSTLVWQLPTSPLDSFFHSVKAEWWTVMRGWNSTGLFAWLKIVAGLLKPSVISSHTGNFPSAHAATQNVHKDDTQAIEHPDECVTQLPTPHIWQRVSSATSEIHELPLCH